jgi:ABC-type polysaccharide/polyol phosphate transport system ATPase subunit
VLVSHDSSAIAELCDRCIWIEHGRINATGTPDEVLGAYLAAAHAAPV